MLSLVSSTTMKLLGLYIPDDVERVGQIVKESFKEAPKWFGVECMDGGDAMIGTSYADVH